MTIIMHAVFCQLLLLLPSLLLLESITYCDALTAAEQQELLNIHNKLRAGEGSSNMQFMTWNANLAYMAQDWANRCVWAHGQGINSSTLGEINVGQNMYQQGSVAKINLTAAVVMWFNEKMSYNYTTNTCAPGQMCGHYTQVVWSESNQLGCGYKICSSTSTIILVCNYGPAGNYVGLLPYKKGPACTQCSTGSFYCTSAGLCDNSCKAASSACICKAACKNCGKTTTNCKCQCSAGWTGVDCADVCRNNHVWCDPKPGVPGWPKSMCGDPTVAAYCPLMCNKCAAAVCPTNFMYIKETGSCYQITLQSLSQLNAQKSCAAKSSHLVYIETEAEKNAVVALWNATFPGQGQIAAWIGACRVGSNPKPFVWSPTCSQSGPPANTVTYPMSYTSWLPPAEPNNNGYDPKKPGTGEWCVEMYFIPSVGYIWNDLPCTDIRGFFICETAPKC